MEIVKEVLLEDVKKTDPIGELFSFFISNQNEAEYSENSKKIYKKLGWCENNYYDVISSFWTTFSFAMHSKYPGYYPIAEAGNVKIYKWHNYRLNIDSFPERYFKEKSEEKRQVDDLYSVYPNIKRLAKLCHSVANFMPCPKGFNSAKGLLKNVNDYFPLMIDKIQECVENGTDLEYYDVLKKQMVQINKETIKEWHTFLIKNRKMYFLDMYYEVNDNTLKGIPFFTKQSLDYPCPKTDSEIKECIKNMITHIEDRASLIVENYGK